jgi:hypothetical protein
LRELIEYSATARQQVTVVDSPATPHVLLLLLLLLLLLPAGDP